MRRAKIISTAPPEDLTKTIARLWPYLWPKNRMDLRVKFYFAIALLVLAKLITALMPFSFKWTVDGLSGVPLPDYLPSGLAVPLGMVALYGVMRIAMVGATQWRDGLFSEIAMSAVRKLSLKTFEHLHALSLRFHLERRTGGLSRVLDRGNKGIEIIVRMTIFTFLPTILELILMVWVLLAVFDARYVAIMLGTIALYMIYTTKATAKRMAIRKTMNESDTDAGTKAVDSLLNYETVKYFGNEKHEIARFDVSVSKYEKASIKTYTSLGWLNFGQALIFTLGMAIMMAICVYDVQSGKASVGDLVMVNAMMIQLYMPLNFMGTVYRETRQALTDIEAMFKLLDQNPEVQDKPEALPLQVNAGELSFENVSFAYDPARPILKGVSFTIPAGQTFAVVGPSGAGKSTLSRLIFRFYEPSGGTISIDGQNIADVKQSTLRAVLGMVPQDTVLFNDTLGYNIRYGLWDASDEQVMMAAKQAQLGDFIASLPEGLNSEVGERGLKLSGGEKQRVAIARTLLKNPPILVLDEATSALDSFTEREIQQALDMISEQRTTLVIAHRLSTIVNANRILVLDGGVIVEMGTHAQLLKKGGLYAGLWERQQREEKLREQVTQ